MKREKRVKQEEKRPTKRFSYDHTSPKPQDQELEKFLPHPISGGGCKTSGEKRNWSTFFRRRSSGSESRFVFRSYLKRKMGFDIKIYFDKVSTRQNKIIPIKPTNENKLFFPGNFNSCLKVSVKWMTFFLRDSPNFSKHFFVVVLKSILLFFFLFFSLETAFFGL